MPGSGAQSADERSDWTPQWPPTGENGELSQHLDLGALQLGPGTAVSPGRSQPGLLREHLTSDRSSSQQGPQLGPAGDQQSRGGGQGGLPCLVCLVRSVQPGDEV